MAEKIAALDEITEAEGMVEVQKDAGHEIGEDVLGGKAESYAQDADPSQHGSHRPIQVQGVEGQDNAETDDRQAGHPGQESGNVPITGEPEDEPVS